MVTGRQLADFEMAHNLTHPPYVDLDDYAEKLNQNGGVCLCDPNRTCPCTQSVEEIGDADDEDAACVCRLFCDQRYAAFWEKSWKKYRRTQEKEEQRAAALAEALVPMEPTQDEAIEEETERELTVEDEEYEAKNESLASMLNALREAKELIINDENAEAFDVLQKEMENHIDCDLCMGVLDAESARALLLAKECEVDNKACKTDSERAIGRIDDLIKRFVDLDKDLIENPIIPELESIGKEQPKEREEGGERTFKDKFHECVSKTLPVLKEEMPGSSPQERFKEATAKCRERKEA